MGKIPSSRHAGLERGHFPGAGRVGQGTVIMMPKRKSGWPDIVGMGGFPSLLCLKGKECSIILRGHLGTDTFLSDHPVTWHSWH